MDVVGHSCVFVDGKKKKDFYPMNESKQPIKFGQVFTVTADVKVMGLATFKAPASSGFECTLPKGTRIVVEDDPPAGAKGVWALPLNYKALESELVPKSIRMLPQYDTYGISMMLDYVGKYFVQDLNSAVLFDTGKMQEFWNRIVEIRERQKDEDLEEYR